jgi:hypothetical protein
MHGCGLYATDLVIVLYKRIPAILKYPSLGTTIEGFYSFFGLPFASSSVLSIEEVGIKNARSANLRVSSMALCKWLAFAGIARGVGQLT